MIPVGMIQTKVKAMATERILRIKLNRDEKIGGTTWNPNNLKYLAQLTARVDRNILFLGHELNPKSVKSMTLKTWTGTPDWTAKWSLGDTHQRREGTHLSFCIATDAIMTMRTLREDAKLRAHFKEGCCFVQPTRLTPIDQQSHPCYCGRRPKPHQQGGCGKNNQE